MANNNALYNAVIAGVMGGTESRRWLLSTLAADYAEEAAVAAAVATQIDSLIPAGTPTDSQVNLLSSLTQAVFADRTATSITPSEYTSISQAVVAAYNQVSTALLSGGAGVSSKYTISVANSSSLATMAASNGDLAFETSRLGVWLFVSGSALPANARKVVAGIGGQWLRLYIAQPFYEGQTTWSIGGASANDQNTGIDDANALASYEEFYFRVGGYWANFYNGISIRVLSDLNEIIEVGPMMWANNSFRVLGVPTATPYTGTISAVTAISPATQQPLQITDAGIAAVGGWAAQLGNRIRLTSGANINSVFYPVKDLGGNVARCTNAMAAIDPTGNPSSAPAQITPGVGDTYVIETLPRIQGIITQTNKPRGTIPSIYATVFDSLDIRADLFGAVFYITNNDAFSYVSRCQIRPNLFVTLGDSSQMVDCMFLPIAQPFFIGREFRIAGGGMLGAFAVDARPGPLLLAREFIFQGSSLLVSGNPGFGLAGGELARGGFCIFDAVGDALRLDPGSTVKQGAGALVWGSGNTGFGIRANNGSRYVIGSAVAADKPILTGASGDTQISGVTVPYANIPQYDAQNGGGIVQ